MFKGWIRCTQRLNSGQTFLLKDDRDHIRVVVSDGHVEGGLRGNAAGVVGERFLCLQVGIGPLLQQLRGEACQSTATRRMKRALTLNTGKVDHVLVSTKFNMALMEI